MNSKEALRTIFINCKEKMLDKNGCIVNSENLVKTILQDLDKLEKLEKENSKFIFNEYCRLDEKHQELKKEYDALMTDYDEKDLECINLEKENQELKNTLLSMEVDTCIPELRKENQELRNSIKSWNENGGNLLKENTKLKEALKFLCEELAIKLCYNKCYDNCMLFAEEYYLDYRSDIDSRTIHRITKEKYNLLEEILENER